MRCCTRLKNVIVVACFCLVLFVVPAHAMVALDSTPPADAPFMGGYWVGGNVSNLGDVVVYVNDNTGWTLNEDGYLFRYSNSTASGRMYVNGTEYNFTASSFSIPRYRLASGTGMQYTDLYLKPINGNILIDDNFATPYDIQTMCAVFSCFMLGMLVVIRLVKRG